MVAQQDGSKTLKIIRQFKAPKKMVFDAFATAEAFAEWWGPVGMKATIKHFDFVPGGKLHYKSEGNGQVMWGLFKYVKIERPDSLEFISSFSDELGNICKSPFPIDFPFEIFNRMIFAEHSGVTTLTLEGYPINASAEQEAVYHSIEPNMQEGYSGTFNKLDAYLNTQFKIR